MQDTVIVTSVEVVDPQWLSDIDYVQFRVFSPTGQEYESSPFQMADDGNKEISGDAIAGDGTYSSKFKFISEEITPGEFRFVFQAKDKGNLLSNTIGHRLTVKVNDSPVISNVIAPDTVKINPLQNTPILITVDVMDSQGLSDIDYVRFRSFLPDGQEANNSPIQLFDDGNTESSGDAVAGDGTYSIIINLPPSGVTPGDFKFVFEAKDKSGALSNTIEHILTVIL